MATKVVFPKGKVHYLETRRSLWALCGRYRWSHLLETLKEVTCKHCLNNKKSRLEV